MNVERADNRTRCGFMPVRRASTVILAVIGALTVWGVAMTALIDFFHNAQSSGATPQ